jgi:hypothetical protein
MVCHAFIYFSTFLTSYSLPYTFNLIAEMTFKDSPYDSI